MSRRPEPVAATVRERIADAPQEPGPTRDERRRALRWTILALASLLPVGCGNSGPRLYPVRGEVYSEGQPAVGAAVHFHPVDKKLPPAYAIVQWDGSFQVSSHSTNDGAAAGEYVVTVNWRDETPGEGETIVGPDRLGGRYSKPETTALKATVTRGENVLTRFDLKK